MTPEDSARHVPYDPTFNCAFPACTCDVPCSVLKPVEGDYRPALFLGIAIGIAVAIGVVVAFR